VARALDAGELLDLRRLDRRGERLLAPALELRRVVYDLGGTW
jgi:hypothetical protein